MFELKDNEFSMGHAYRFSGRIGIYRPDYAIIVSTKGISSDVKDYFKKIKPQSVIVYVENLNQLRSTIDDIIIKGRTQRAIKILDNYTSVTLDILPLLTSKLGLPLPDKRKLSFTEQIKAFNREALK